MKEMTKDAFVKEHCPIIARLVEDLIKNFHPEYIVAYEVLDLYSPHVGEKKVLAVGPNNTVKTLADAEKSKQDMELRSTIKLPIAYCKV